MIRFGVSVLLVAYICLVACAAGAAPLTTARDEWGNLHTYQLLPVSVESSTHFQLRDTSPAYPAGYRDIGRAFPLPSDWSGTATVAAVAYLDDTLLLARENEGEIRVLISRDRGRSFSRPIDLIITGETASSPVWAFSQAAGADLAALSDHADVGLHRLWHYRFDPSSSEAEIAATPPRPITAGYDQISSPLFRRLKDSLLLLWQEGDDPRWSTYYAYSFDQGDIFSDKKRLENFRPVSDLFFKADKLWGETATEPPALTELTLDQLQAPRLIIPSDRQPVSNLKEIAFVAAADEHDPILCRLEISGQVDLARPRISLTALVTPSSSEAAFILPPGSLTDGEYFWRVTAQSGLGQKRRSPVRSLTVDNVLPTLTSLESERTGRSIIFLGQVSETGTSVGLADSLISWESGRRFSCAATLESGPNVFTFILSDEAGNQALVSYEAHFDPASPEVALLSPAENDWFSPGSTILLEVEIFDPKNILTDKEEPQLLVDGRPLDHYLAYDEESGRLSGFLTLADDLTDGRHPVRLIFRSAMGGELAHDLSINIDRSGPRSLLGNGARHFSASGQAVKLPLTDAGAGIDPAGTLVTLGSLSREVAVSVEADGIVLTPAVRLVEGSYEVTVQARDLVGNTAEAVTLTLYIDTTKPELKITQSPAGMTTGSRALFEGEVIDDYPAKLVILNNGHEVRSLALSDGRFSTEVPLAGGQNDLRLEAYDLAGNMTARSFLVAADIRQAGGLISNFANGPNPFSPDRRLPAALAAEGKGMVFSYGLERPADVTIRIYDLTGTLVWIRRISQATSGVTAWSGVDNFGRVCPNGVYPFFFTADGGGASENRRGKILIAQ